LSNVAGDVMAAARRFGFRRRHDQHPVDSLDDADVAVAGILLAFLEMGNLPSAEQHLALTASLCRHLHQSTEKAREALILGRWLVQECGTQQAGFSRLSKRLFKLRGVAALEPLMQVLRDVSAEIGDLAPRQREALEDIKRIFRLT
jgi:hypothetical protein